MTTTPRIFLTKTISSQLFLAPGLKGESEWAVSSSGVGWLRDPQATSVAAMSQPAQATAGAGVQPDSQFLEELVCSAAPVPAGEREGGVCR